MKDPKVSMPRRGVMAGAGAVGAIAAVASVLPHATAPSPSDATSEPAKAPEGAAGYRLTDHIRRYYASTRI
jgi:hypothetical protein